MGLLDNAIETLLVRETDEHWRYMSSGEFQAAYSDANSTVPRKFEMVANLFLDFPPKKRPILWRMLITQAHIYQALMRTRETKDGTNDNSKHLVMPVPEGDRHYFDWRRSEAEAMDEKILVEPFEAARTYLRDHLEGQFGG